MQMKDPYCVIVRAFKYNPDGKMCYDEEARMLIPVGVEGVRSCLVSSRSVDSVTLIFCRCS